MHNRALQSAFALTGALAVVGIGSPHAKAMKAELVEPPVPIEVAGQEPSGVGPIAEVPLIALKQGDSYKYLISTNKTTACESVDPFSSSVPLIGKITINCTNQLSRLDQGDFLRYSPDKMPKRTPWKSHYSGVMAAEYIADHGRPERGTLISILHGEHKNETRLKEGGTDYYQNQINPEALAVPGPSGFPFGRSPDSGLDIRRQPTGSFYCPGGYLSTNYKGESTAEHMIAEGGYVPDDLSTSDPGREGYYSNCHEAYNGFIFSAVRRVRTADTLRPFNKNDDKGPIIWPSAGYTDSNGRKTSHGVRHPSSMVDGNYLYVYYMDTSNSPDVNQGIIKVARSPLSAKGMPGSFKSWQADGKHGRWVKSLPFKNKSQFADNRERFYETKGPVSDGIISGSTRADSVHERNAQRGYLRFSPARLLGATRKYIAISQQYTVGTNRYKKDACGVEIKLHTSFDAVRWSKGRVIPGLNACNDTANQLFYPVPLDAKGEGSDIVDPRGFYIMGAKAGVPYRAKVRLK